MSGRRYSSYSTESLQDGGAESQRIKKIFQDIDGWVERDSGFVLNVAFPANRAKDGTFLGLDVSREFYHILYDGNDGRLPYDWDGVIALFCDNTKASYLYHRFKFMVNYLESGRGTERVGAFIEAIREDKESHWEVIPQAEEDQINYAWKLLWNVLHFRDETAHQSNTFKQQIDVFFPLQPEDILRSTSFSTTLKELETIELVVKPTRHFHEHLLVEGDMVFIYQLRYEDIKSFLSYDNNKAAKALGIANLGDEIRASLYALYGKDELHTKAQTLEIFVTENEQQRLLCGRFLELSANTEPKLFAYRARILRKLVDHQLSWWPSLVRDVKKQSRTQPLHFYGAIFAILFGVCTVIQTIASIWSLVRA